MKCRFCNNKVESFLDMSHIPISVTSEAEVVNVGIVLYRCVDCGLIQKDASAQSQSDYFQNDYNQSLLKSEEQVKFVGGIPFPKSELIVSGVKKYIKNPQNILDIGTGSGAFLSAFKKEFPSCEMYGQDIQDNFIEDIARYIPKENFFYKDIGEIDKKFDLISMIGVLSHIPLLLAFLKNLKDISNDETQILIHTSDFPTNFFEIVIIDCITHISKPMLYKILSKYYQNISFHNTVFKETTVGINLSENESFFDLEKEEKMLHKQKDIFKNFMDFIYYSNKSYSILGSSPTSIYIGAMLKQRLIDLIDEDVNRIGKIHLNREIKSFDNISKDNTIILPFLQKNIVESIKLKYSHLSFLSYLDI